MNKTIYKILFVLMTGIMCFTSIFFVVIYQYKFPITFLVLSGLSSLGIFISHQILMRLVVSITLGSYFLPLKEVYYLLKLLPNVGNNNLWGETFIGVYIIIFILTNGVIFFKASSELNN